jgi:hypothetical protein
VVQRTVGACRRVVGGALALTRRLPWRARWSAAAAVGVVLIVGVGVAAWGSGGDRSSAGDGRDESSVASDAEPGEVVSPGDEVEATPDTTVPAGDGEGSIHETVEVDPEAVAAVAEPIGIDETADFGNGVTARITSVESVEAEGHLPGEFSGPAVALTIEVTNRSDDAVDLGTVTADLTFGDGLSAYPVFDPERPPFSGEVAPGDVASGSYVFTLDPSERDDVALRLSYSTEVPTVIFAGSVADG